MFRNIIFTSLILITFQAISGLVNVNPDPNGEEWIAGGFRAPDNFDRSSLNFIDNIPSKSKDLPSRVDNSLYKYFRPVFNQVGGSCSQAAGVGYTFTYEINRLRDLASNTLDTQYPTHFTYNFLNEGSGEVGSWWGDGWDIINSVGIMNITAYGGHFAYGGNSRWISGLQEWSDAQFNRVKSYSSIEVGTPEGLNNLKNWLHNHLEDSQYGGLAVFAAGATSYVEKTLPVGTHEAGKKVITKWGPEMNHAMTYVGYDDSVRFDYNGDGRFTNDVDLNGDRIIDMRDWEIGAVIVANSWGTSFGNGGFIYQMYKVLAEKSCEEGGIYYNMVQVVNPVAVSEPRWALEVKMKHTQRNLYRISTGASQDVNSETPSFTKTYPYMNYQGGDYYPKGGRTEDDKYIDFSMDISESVIDIDTGQPFRFFFMLDESDPDNHRSGAVISIAVINRDTGRRYYSTSSPVIMTNNGRTTVSLVIDENTFVPENLVAYGGDGIVKLEWANNPAKTTNFLHFNVYRNDVLYASELTENSFTDPDVINGTLYTYKIAAEFSGTYTGEIFSYPVQAMPEKPSTLPYFIDFENGSPGWTLKGTLAGWMNGNDTYSSEFCDYTGNSTKFLIANPDLAGSDTIVIDYAVTPVFNISNYDMVSLEFDYILNNYSEFYYCDISVMYRTGFDQNWILIEQLADAFNWTHKTIQVPYQAVSSNFTQIGFLMDDYYRWSMGGGGIDNVSISGTFYSFAPIISGFYPLEAELSVCNLEPVNFSVDVQDDDTGPSELLYDWFVDDILVQSGNPEFQKIFDKCGVYKISVTVSDSYSETSHTWNVDQAGNNENIPTKAKLYQNYPNPFNPSTVIQFDNIKDSFTTLNIYNSNGQIVRTLYKGMLDQGSQSFIWNGKDDRGVLMSSGVYYYTIKSGNYSKTQKMVMFK